MYLLRILILIALLASALSFVLYAVTGQVRHRKRGRQILMWTMLGAFGFFAVLIVERLW